MKRKRLISDIHIGSEDCKAESLLELLEKSPDDEEWIIVGDLFQEGGVISDKQFEVIEWLRKNRKRVICVDGNHDPIEKGLIEKIIGINVLKKYEWWVFGKKICAIHGHQFDRLCFFFREPLIDKMFINFLWFLRMINIQGFNVAKWIDNIHNRFSRHIASKAIKYAKKHKIDVIICGHTHMPSHFVSSDKNGRTIDYYNCGGWIDNPCSFIIIDENCKIELRSIFPN